jgi:hypothetical protein
MDMIPTWNQLKESDFDRESYLECERVGLWKAQVDALAYSHCGQTMATGRGGRKGIHLFVRAEDGVKFRLYAMYRGDSVPHARAKDLLIGDRIQLETTLTGAGKTWIKSLEVLT